MKTCNTCTRWKSCREFDRDRRNMDGLAGTCKECDRLRRRARYVARNTMDQARDERGRFVA